MCWTRIRAWELRHYEALTKMMDRDALLSALSALSRDIALADAVEDGRAWRSIANALERIERGLVRPARLAVFGEEKTGKSSLINFLLKRAAVPSGGLPGQGTYLLVQFARESAMYAVAADGSKTRLTSKAMSRITASDADAQPKPLGNVIYDASNPTRPSLHAGTVAAHLMGSASAAYSDAGRLIELGLPQPILRDMELLEARDYPRDRVAPPVARAFRFIDIAIWCTLSTQAWKETERSAWRAIPAGHRRLAALLVTYKDAVRNAKDEEKILARLRNEARGAFNTVVLASLRDALAAEIVPDDDEAARLRETANAQVLEDAVSTLVDDWRQHRVRKALGMLARISARLTAIADREENASARHYAQRVQQIAAMGE